MPDIWIDVDTAITIPVNKVPLVASSDGFTIDETIAYNESGMDLNWNFVTTAGVQTQTNVSPTSAGDYDWTHVGNGMYKIEMTASGGASADNDTEGFGWFSGKADAICPFSGPTIGFRKASMNNVMIDNGTLQDNLENMYDGTGYVGGTIVLKADLTKIGGDAQSATDLKDFADVGYDPTNNVTQSDLIYIHGTALTETAGQLAAAFVKLFNVGTPLLVASDVMVGTDSAALSSAMTTAQNDLDIITGATGVVIQDGTITAAKLGADCITNAKIADDAIAAENFATGAIAADAVASTALDNIVMSDLAQGAPSATASIVIAINVLYEAFRNKTLTTATLITIMKDNGTTALMKSTISDDSTTFTKAEFISGA